MSYHGQVCDVSDIRELLRTAQEHLSLPDGSGPLESILWLSQTRLFPIQVVFSSAREMGIAKSGAILTLNSQARRKYSAVCKSHS